MVLKAFVGFMKDIKNMIVGENDLELGVGSITNPIIEEKNKRKKKKKRNIPLLEISKGVFHHYKRSVKGNSNTPFIEVQKKLTRNVLLAERIINHDERTSDKKKLYQYGNLSILVIDNTVVWIKNEPSKKKFKKDENYYRYLNTVLGIKHSRKLTKKIA